MGDYNAIVDCIAIVLTEEATVAALTIRNIDEGLKRELRQQAAANDRSMEEEARVILRAGLARPARARRPGFATEIRRLVEQHGGGYDLELPKDEPFEPMKFE